ncbi:MAG: glycosyltransferase family 4 protein [Planctomycetes bacterium]|nr:glycosyltransferase family 4 protein [Planctomycetota bacterium]
MISLYLPSETKMGVGYQAHAMANALVARGHGVTLFTPCAKPDGALYDLHHVDVGTSLRTFRFAWNLKKIDFSGFDVIHAHGDNYWLWSRRHRPAVIRTMHGSCLAEAWKVPGIKEKLRMLILYGAEVLATLVSDKTVCVSASTLRYYPGLRTVIPNGVDLRAFTPAMGNSPQRHQGTKTGRDTGLTTEVVEGRGENKELSMIKDGLATEITENNGGMNPESGSQNLEVDSSAELQNNLIIDHCSLITEKSSVAKCSQPQSTQSVESVDDSCPVSVTSSETISPNSSPSVSSVSSVANNPFVSTKNSEPATLNLESVLNAKRMPSSSVQSVKSVDRTAAKADVPTILFVGTYGNRKRGKLLMEIFARDILPKLPAAQLWMVCSDAPPAANVSVLGRISQQELINRYRRAWAFCLPSTYEGFGIPYIEAMAAGTAVVASPNVGAVEVTRNGRDGLVVADDKLGQTLLQVLTDKTLRHKLEAAGLERVKDFDLNKVCEQYEEIYTGLIKKNNPSTDCADTAD